jgi:hypothetical protein
MPKAPSKKTTGASSKSNQTLYSAVIFSQTFEGSKNDSLAKTM